VPWGRIDDGETTHPLIDGSHEVATEARFDCPRCGETMARGKVVALWD
jgi:hypothetical protein